MATWRETKKEATERRICHEAVGLFRRKGYHSTTVEQIAAASEVSRATVFNYFPNKKAIIHKWIENGLEFYLDKFHRDVLDRGGEDALLDAFIEEISEEMEKNRELFREVLGEVIDSPTGSETDWRTHFIEMVERCMKEWVARFGNRYGEGRLPRSDSQAAEMLSGAFMMTVVNWLSSGGGYPLFRRLKDNLDVVWRGLNYVREVRI